jgi:hypothetical protein
MPLFGHKTGFRARMNEIKSGIPCSVANILPRYKRTNPKKKATHRRVIACVCIFVNPSCKYFTPIQTHRADNKQRLVMSSRACVFGNPILQIFYQDTNAPIRKKQRIVLSFCKRLVCEIRPFG